MNILSLENSKMWSWGLTVDQLKKHLPTDCEIVRIVRGQIYCPNPKCKRLIWRNVDEDLTKFFDATLIQNCDGIKLIKNKPKAVTRMGGLDMSNPDSNRYDEEIRQVGAVIATNKQLYDIAIKANPDTFLIPNGVELDTFKPATANPNLDRMFTLGFAGNIWGGGADYKGWKYYVQACMYLSAEVVYINLLHNASQIPHTEMPENFYHKIDALVLPSRGEGCSNVVTEALACGVPVLLTKVGYHGETLEDGVNCLFIKRDADMIKETVRKLIGDLELRKTLAVNGRKFAEENHDVRLIAAKYDEVFKKVLEKNQSLKGAS